MKLFVLTGASRGMGAALAGFLGVALGAFAAHGLKNTISPPMLAAFETGVRYQMYHALAMILAGMIVARGASTAGWIFQLGIFLFSGSLYVLALTDIKVLGAVTPFGGLAFLAGWIWLAWSAWRG